jgi:hypothetical protein
VYRTRKHAVGTTGAVIIHIRGVFKFKKYNPTKFNKVYIFKLRIVNKIKGKAINALFKKLRLII